MFNCRDGITAVGMDGAAVLGEEISLRAEIVYTLNRYLYIDRELWGYPSPACTR